jgi:chemotaxis protein methyltransferase CheR
VSDPAAVLARLVEEVSGNVVPAAHLPFLARAAATRVTATGQRDLAAYVDALGRGALPEEWGNLLPLVTVNESYLFRTPQHFAALATTLLPGLLATRATARRLRVWSAGCACGEEPATLAMVLADAPALAGWDWRVIATDVDDDALAAARRGVYGARAVASVPAAQRERYLTGGGDAYSLAPSLLSRIEYRSLNLVREPFADPGGPFDVVFLRNVLIYFRPHSQRRVAAAVAATLARDGLLFVGPAETLWQLTDELEPVDLGDCFCYRRGRDHPTAQGSAPRAPGAGNAGVPTPRGRPAQPPRHRAERGSAPPPPARPGAPAREGPAAVTNSDRLREAARHLLSDRLQEAVDLVDQALAADPGDAQAHALEGFVHDISGRSEMAIASLRAALYLDPSLYQAHLMLGDALRRLGWMERARTAYRAVIDLLDRGGGRDLADLAALPLANREAAGRRARAALHGR